MSCFAAGLIQGEKEVEANQILSMKNDCIQVLGKLDRENPGLIPVPHDGVEWSVRATKT
jgi:hypothetical protein